MIHTVEVNSQLRRPSIQNINVLLVQWPAYPVVSMLYWLGIRVALALSLCA